MRIKSYFTNTVESAVSLARVELGPDALLISVRRTGPETKTFGNYEVVFGLSAPDPAKAQSVDPAGLDRQRNLHPLPASERLSDRAALLDAQVDSSGRNETQDALVSETEAQFEISSGPPADPARPWIAAMIGPHGAGKTTTLVKLAVLQGIAANRPVEIVSLDTNRVGAKEMLRAYATVLNVGFYPLDNPALLPHAIEDLIDRNVLILIDTPGCGPDAASLSALAKTLGRRQDIESHLVLPATMSERELRRTVDRFSIFRPASLLFTRIDETVGFGRILSESGRTKTPLSFFGTGPEIPEDLERATKRGLDDLVLGRRRKEALSAA